MSVYVDPNLEWPKTKKWPYGSVSHMYADTEEELHKLAKKIGFKREWCSDHTHADSPLLHYDLSPKMREKAIQMGAVEVGHEHSRPYSLRGCWFWEAFVDYMAIFKKGFVPTPANYKKWVRTMNAFKRGAVFGFKYAKEKMK